MTKDRKARPLFSELIAGYEHGTFDADVADALADLMHSTRERESKGTLTVKVTLIPSAEDSFSVELEHAVTMPRRKRRALTYFSTLDGRGLTRRHPFQPQGDLFDPDAIHVRNAGPVDEDEDDDSVAWADDDA